MWLSSLEIGAAQRRSVTEIAPPQPFLCVNRSPSRYDFHGVRYSTRAKRFLGTLSKFRKRNKMSSLLVYVLHKGPVIIYRLGVGDFCCDNWALTWSPLKGYSVVLTPHPPPPHWRWKTSWFPLFGHLIWTELSVKSYSSHPNRWKQSHCRSRPSHCRILPHILHPLIPRHFHLWHHGYTISLCSQTLWCVGNNDSE